MLVCLISFFFLLQVWLRHWATQDCKDAKLQYVYPYDKGWMRNWKEVFGSSYYLWPVPTLPESDALRYSPIAPEQLDFVRFGV
jgi:hypothetical protein